jgi:3-oxoacyl-[acyl-carrier-protein] synthase II
MAQGRRVVVTGLGVVTPIGNTVEEYWQGLLSGRNGVGRITKFEISDSAPCTVAAEVKIDFEQHFDRKENRKLEDFVKFAMIAARDAAKDSGILQSGLSTEEIGCVMGIGIGGIGFTEAQCKQAVEKGGGRTSPMLIPRIIANIAPGQVAIDLGLKGPSLAIVTACAASTHALGEASEQIKRGDATAILAGGAEGAICEVAIYGFGNMQALASGYNDRPLEACRPFDAKRSGFVMGEGAGVVVLEEYEHAKARGAKIYAEYLGYGQSTDAYHITAPSPEGEGAARAMALALKHAGLAPTAIDYINAHGTSTPLNDKNETLAVKSVFGEHAYKLAMSSTKSMTGHLLGAAGAIEAVAGILALRDQILPPTINQTDPDPECDLDYVPNVARKAVVHRFMSNSLGFGGHNASIIFGQANGA